MKYVEIVISKILIYLTYLITYLIPVKKNRVAIISYFNKEPGLEFSGLIKMLIEEDIEIKEDFHRFKGTLWGKFKYLFSFIYQTYLFNTSRIVILDGNSYVYASIKTKKKVETIQLWHAIGAIKKFGMDTKRRYKIKGYDNLIVSSAYFKKVFSKALNTKEEKTFALGNIKTDYLFDKEYLNQLSEKFYHANPQLKNKKLILYAPTFRGEGIEDMSYEDSGIDKLQELLSDEYQVIVRLHPLVKNKMDNVLEIEDADLYTLLYVCDYIISDYSALVFDAAALNKKIILYLYDLDNYLKTRGTYLDLGTLSIKKAYKIEDIYDIICSEVNINDNSLLMKDYLEKIDGMSTKRIYDFIVDIMRR